MANFWIRLYCEVLDDPKVQMIEPYLFKFWINCMCLTANTKGFLPEVPELAFRLREKEFRITEYIEELLQAGLLDEMGDSYRIHGWADRQFESDSSRERMKNYRARLKKKSVTVTVTSPVTVQDLELENRIEKPNLHRRSSSRRPPRFGKPTNPKDYE